MIRYQRADATHPHFIALVEMLDRELAIRDGADHAFYHQFNHLTDIKHTVIAYRDETPAACGAFKAYDAESVEIKRMFTHPDHRQQGIAAGVLAELEAWAAELGYQYCVLETGMKQPEAIALYGKQGYARIANYGQYAGVDNSVCMQKELNS